MLRQLFCMLHVEEASCGGETNCRKSRGRSLQAINKNRKRLISTDVLIEVLRFLQLSELIRFNIINRLISKMIDKNPVFKRPRTISYLLVDGLKLCNKLGRIEIAKGPVPCNICAFGDIRIYDARAHNLKENQRFEEVVAFFSTISPFLHGHTLKINVKGFPFSEDPKLSKTPKNVFNIELLKALLKGVKNGFALIRLELDSLSTELDFKHIFSTKAFSETNRIRICHRYPRQCAHWRLSKGLMNKLISWLFQRGSTERTLLLQKVYFENMDTFVAKIIQRFASEREKGRPFRIIVVYPHSVPATLSAKFRIPNWITKETLSQSGTSVPGQEFLISRELISNFNEGNNVASTTFDYEQFDHEDREIKNVVGVYWLLAHTHGNME